MGIQDRDYYRDESGGAFGWPGGVSVWGWLVLLNVFAFLVQMATKTPRTLGDGWFTEAFALVPDKVLRGEVWRLLTYAFLHDTRSIGHIFFNMFFLWMFGREVEGIYGPKEFLGFYLAGAVLGGVAFMVWAAAAAGGSVIGASGAVTAVMVVFACHYPTRVVLLFFVLPVPVVLIVAFQVAKDFVGMVGGSAEPVAFSAHLGGAAFGFLYYKLQWRVTGWLPSLPSAGRTRSKPAPRLRVYREEEPAPAAVEAAPAAPAAGDDEQLEAKLDRVLEKVARDGQASLSETEREVLFRASEIYKRRRR